MNRVQRTVIVLFVFIVVADLLTAEVLTVVHGTGLVTELRDVVLVTAFVLLAQGVLLAGGSRVYPIKEGVEDSPLFTTPSFQRVLLRDRASRETSEYPVVGFIYGIILLLVDFALYLLPA